MSDDGQHKMARALIAAHVDAHVAPIVLKAFDKWSEVVLEAEEALEHQRRSDLRLHRFYTVRELTVLLRKSDTNVRKLIAEGTLPRTQLGGSIVVSIEATEAYIAAQTSQEVVEKPAPRARRKPNDEAVLDRYEFLAS